MPDSNQEQSMAENVDEETSSPAADAHLEAVRQP